MGNFILQKPCKTSKQERCIIAEAQREKTKGVGTQPRLHKKLNRSLLKKLKP
jgi:hypothetical protein